MKHTFEHKVRENDKWVSKWEEYFDTNDPYTLIEEAKDARAMLDAGFIEGSEFAIGRDDDGNAVNTVADYADPRIRYVCSIGAVFKVQGHHVYDCNLIVQLGKTAYQMLPPKNRPDIESFDKEDWGELVVDVNDTHGKKAALVMFDHTINHYQQQINEAEEYAAAYGLIARVPPPFSFTHHSTPINYGCGPNGCTVPEPVKEEVTL